MSIYRCVVFAALPLALLGCVLTSSPKPATEVVGAHSGLPSADTWSSHRSISEVTAILQAGSARAKRFHQERLPALEHDFTSAIAHLDAPGATEKERHQAQVDIREADYQANQITLDSGLQLNAVEALARPWSEQCASAVTGPDDCAPFVAALSHWVVEKNKIWATLTGPVVKWRDDGNAAIRQHSHDPVVPVDYKRGMPQCRPLDPAHPFAQAWI